MATNCCEKCQVCWTCETKWYRGEKHEENICCTICDYYRRCQSKDKIKNKAAKSNS